MIGRLSRRAKVQIYLSATLDARLADRRATQSEREKRYREHQARSIRAAIARDVVMKGATGA